MTVTVDAGQVERLLRLAAEQEILPRFKTLQACHIREKKPGQLVTDADEAAERLLAHELTRILPGAVVGEEGVDADPSLLDALSRPGPVWIIDPVDGTANFAHGRPRFAVVVALVVDGVTRMGWIHDPIPNRTVFAAQGEGAWMGGQRLRVRSEAPLNAMDGSVKKKGAWEGKVASAARRGSAAHDYLDLVTDHLHFAHFKRLMPWDHAAGVLIHAEAGGFGAMMDGSAYRPLLSQGALLLAPGEASWRQLQPLLEQ